VAHESILRLGELPLTQNGFVRVISNPGYSRPVALSDAVALLSAQVAEPGHVFWADDISLLDASVFNHARFHGPSQITDAYLLALAAKNGGRLVTLDRGIALAAVRGVQSNQVVVL
jgi:toxin-antitoxin system PIN domain toxin